MGHKPRNRALGSRQRPRPRAPAHCGLRIARRDSRGRRRSTYRNAHGCSRAAVRESRTAVRGSRRGAALVDDVAVDGRYGRRHRPSGGDARGCSHAAVRASRAAVRGSRRGAALVNDVVLDVSYGRRHRSSGADASGCSRAPVRASQAAVSASCAAVRGNRRGAALIDDVALESRYGRRHRPSGAVNGSFGEV